MSASLLSVSKKIRGQWPNVQGNNQIHMQPPPPPPPVPIATPTLPFLHRSYLALVCLMQAEHFNNKEGLIEYNVNCFKQTLAQVFKRPPLRMVSCTALLHDIRTGCALCVVFPAI